MCAEIHLLSGEKVILFKSANLHICNHKHELTDFKIGVFHRLATADSFQRRLFCFSNCPVTISDLFDHFQSSFYQPLNRCLSIFTEFFSDTVGNDHIHTQAMMAQQLT
jgi:hypothetical protein